MASSAKPCFKIFNNPVCSYWRNAFDGGRSIESSDVGMKDLEERILCCVVIGAIGTFMFSGFFFFQATNWRSVTATVESVREMCSYQKRREGWHVKGRRRYVYRHIPCDDDAAALRLTGSGFVATKRKYYELKLTLKLSPIVPTTMDVSIDQYPPTQIQPGNEIEVQQSRIDRRKVKPAGRAWIQFKWTFMAFLACLLVLSFWSGAFFRWLYPAEKS